MNRTLSQTFRKWPTFASSLSRVLCTRDYCQFHVTATARLCWPCHDHRSVPHNRRLTTSLKIMILIAILEDNTELLARNFFCRSEEAYKYINIILRR